MKDPAKKIMRDIVRELDEVIAEMKIYDDAYKHRQQKKKEEERRNAQHRG